MANIYNVNDDLFICYSVLPILYYVSISSPTTHVQSHNAPYNYDRRCNVSDNCFTRLCRPSKKIRSNDDVA